jgi:GGDEF domain-containing protein
VARTRHSLRDGGADPVKVTISVGVALFSPKLADAMLIAHADMALYQAKRDGKNRAIVARDE